MGVSINSTALINISYVLLKAKNSELIKSQHSLSNKLLPNLPASWLKHFEIAVDIWYLYNLIYT